MDPQPAVEFGREAIRTCLMIGGPILLATLVLGLLISILQAMTQLHDQAISFVPKILLLLVTIAACLPWFANQLLDFSRLALTKPMLIPVVTGEQTGAFGSLDNPQFESGSPSNSTPRVAIRNEQDLPPSRLEPSWAGPASVANPQPDGSNFESAESIDESDESEQDLEKPENWKSPFVLPHYRFQRETGDDLEG